MTTARVLWGLVRPRGLPWVLLLPTFGYGFAHWSHALLWRYPGAFVAILAAWACVHAGTMWLNAALDHDEGEVLLGEPLPVPDGIEVYAVVALIAGPMLAALAGAGPFACAATCSLLAVLYSAPHIAWKGHPVAGPAINVLGYGVLSPLAGWSIVGVHAGPRTIVALCALVPLTCGIYFAAQAFQRDEDAARGYRTLVVTHGPATALAAARAGFIVGFGLLAALIVVGWFPRWCALAFPAIVAVDQHLARWHAAVGAADRFANTEATARVLARRLMWVAGLLILGAYVAYGVSLYQGVGAPVAGMATAGGFPG